MPFAARWRAETSAQYAAFARRRASSARSASA
jgi:hypothetical protein